MFFEQFGALLDSVVMFDRETKNSRGFGFVTFEDPVRDFEGSHGRVLNHRLTSKSAIAPTPGDREVATNKRKSG